MVSNRDKNQSNSIFEDIKDVVSTEPKLVVGKLNAAKGFANENRFLAALLARGYNASRVDLPDSTYDIVVEKKSTQEILRVQVKTVGRDGRVSFIGGLRGGVDRQYKSGVKEYTQNTSTSDVVVGVKSERSNGDKETDYYIIPTLFIEKLGQKKSLYK